MRYIIIPLVIILYIWWTITSLYIIFCEIFGKTYNNNDFEGAMAWIILHGGVLLAVIIQLIIKYW